MATTNPEIASPALEPYSIDLEFDVLPDTQADVQQLRTRSKYRKDWYERVYWEVYQKGKRPAEPLELAAIYGVRHSSQQPDRINLWYSFKPLVDGLIRAGVIKDDAPRYLASEHYSWEWVPKGEAWVSLRVVEIRDPQDKCGKSRPQPVGR